jgi:hypothetical protein
MRNTGAELLWSIIYCDYLMGVTGAAFCRFWNRDGGGNVDLACLGDEPFRRAL